MSHYNGLRRSSDCLGRNRMCWKRNLRHTNEANYGGFVYCLGKNCETDRSVVVIRHVAQHWGRDF